MCPKAPPIFLKFVIVWLICSFTEYLTLLHLINETHVYDDLNLFMIKDWWFNFCKAKFAMVNKVKSFQTVS